MNTRLLNSYIRIGYRSIDQKNVNHNITYYFIRLVQNHNVLTSTKYERGKTASWHLALLGRCSNG